MVLPLRRYQDVLWSVELKLGGHPATLLVDTAAGITALAPTELARLDRRPEGRLTGYRMSGERIDMQRCPGVPLEIDGTIVHHEMVGVFDPTPLLPPDWTPVGGVLSLSSFTHQPVILDFPRRELRLVAPADLGRETRGLHPLRVRTSRPVMGFGLDLFVEVDTPGGMAYFELDCANTGPALVAPHTARMLGWDVEPAAPGPRELRLPGAEPLALAVTIKDIIYDGNLGATFTDARRFVFDLPAERAWFSDPA